LQLRALRQFMLKVLPDFRLSRSNFNFELLQFDPVVAYRRLQSSAKLLPQFSRIFPRDCNRYLLLSSKDGTQCTNSFYDARSPLCTENIVPNILPKLAMPTIKMQPDIELELLGKSRLNRRRSELAKKLENRSRIHDRSLRHSSPAEINVMLHRPSNQFEWLRAHGTRRCSVLEFNSRRYR
jgi:hypothetical protein